MRTASRRSPPLLLGSSQALRRPDQRRARLDSADLLKNSWRYEVVHSLPGRVRLRIAHEDAAGALGFAQLLTDNPLVMDVRWVAVIRSMTVRFDRTVSFEEVVKSLPESAGREALPAEVAQRPLWRQFLLPAVALGISLTGAGFVARIALAVCALPIARRAVRSLLARRLTIDVLDVTAVSLLLVTGDVLAGGVTLSLVETGERLRQRASGRARRVLRAWMGADPRGVRVVRDGSEPHVPLVELQPGERVVVYAGETIPVDGVVVSGSGSVDTRTWTGELLPRAAESGTTVLAGSAMADGRIVIAVSAKGEETRAGRLAAALEDAIAANTAVSDLARRIANAFVGPLFLLSGAAFAVTGDLSRLISILIIDFGTGIRIAVPTTVLSTMIKGARSGVLFKNGRGLEELAKVDTLVFDKTGTLTTGRPFVVRVTPEPGNSVDSALRLGAAAEGHLPHPLARAIRRAARARGLQLPEPEWVRYQPGGGVQARVEGHHVLLGDHRLLRRHGVVMPGEGLPESSLVLIAIDGRLAARVRLRDKIREGTGAVISRLRSTGISRLWLATGDHAGVARSVSQALGLDGFDARLMPEDKVRLVRELRREGRKVALVGDGINDAAAMAEANVGIAVTRGADLARETADVVLLNDDLQTLVTAVKLSRQAMGIVRENIGLVAAPNAVGLGLAISGRLTPLSAALVNNGSTVFAGVNALRPLAFG